MADVSCPDLLAAWHPAPRCSGCRRHCLTGGLRVVWRCSTPCTLSVALNGAAVATVLVIGSAAFTAMLAGGAQEAWGGPSYWRGPQPERCVLVAGALDAAAWRANLMGIATG